jgi:hypothetical protein
VWGQNLLDSFYFEPSWFWGPHTLRDRSPERFLHREVLPIPPGDIWATRRRGQIGWGEITLGQFLSDLRDYWA